MYDLANDNTKHYLGQNNFKLAIGFHKFGGGTPRVLISDQTYFKVSVNLLHTRWENDEFNNTIEYLDYGVCNKSEFPEITQKEFDRLALSTFLCIK